MIGREMVKVAGAALLAGLFVSTPVFAQRTFTVSWWGYNGEKMTANIITPFEKICDCNVVFETGNNADRLNKLKARGGKGVDVIYLTDVYSQQGIDQGLFQKLDRTKLPNLANIYKIGRDPQGGYGPAYTIGRIGLVYNAKTVKPLTSWNDLWRADLKGTESLPDITTTAGPMVVLKAADHAGVNAYADPDKTFAAVAALKPNVVKNYLTGSDLVNLISTGEVSVTMTQDFTLASMQQAVPSMTWASLKDGDIAVLNTVNIPKGSQNTDLAYKFINFILSTKVQQAEAEQGVDAPISTKVVLQPAQAKLWTYGAKMVNSLQRLDYAKMIAATPGWIDRWNDIFGM
jgi:putative spermidine/putrescine transport system substrate-binding protein